MKSRSVRLLFATLILLLAGSPAFAHSATLSWTDSVTPGVVSYDVYRAQCTVPYSNVGGVFENVTCSFIGSPSLIGSTSSSGLVDTAISAGQSYEYYVTAVCGSGCTGMSGPSNTVVITVAPAPPTNPVVPSVH